LWRHTTPREVAQPGIGSSVSFHPPLHNSPCHSFPLHSPEWQRLRNANDGAMPLILNVGFHLHDEIRQKKISITFCCHQHFPAFFSRMSGIGTLHYHDHLPTPVSSVSCHGCYHNMVSGIQPYFHSPDKKELISV